ncbi:MAG: IPT/TIG domain-containing protein, partial [Candidatus Nomurabacteria bacterium]|nr:IPT/TIG domain-containing protein [Candidatus Nomurabacteria bacterium]
VFFVLGVNFVQPWTGDTRGVSGLGLASPREISMSFDTEYINISLDRTINPTPINSTSHTVHVSTNNPTGYNLRFIADWRYGYDYYLSDYCTDYADCGHAPQWYGSYLFPSQAFLEDEEGDVDYDNHSEYIDMIYDGQLTDYILPANGWLDEPKALGDNTWGYAIPGVDGFDNTYAKPVPSVSSLWAAVPSASLTWWEYIKTTDTSTEDDPTTIYYAAKAGSSLPDGDYAQQVVYEAYTNTDTTIPAPTIESVTPSVIPANTSGITIEIVGTNFTKNNQSATTDVSVYGYSCLNVSISSNTPTTGKDTIYCTLQPLTSTGTKYVYVETWRDDVSKTIFVYGSSLQLFTSSHCAALGSGTAVDLLDTRDNKTYRVRKMADGKCWMIDNLAFDLANSKAPVYSPAAGLVSGTDPSVDTQAQYFLNSDHSTTAGDITYLYNWCAAMGDTSTNCTTTKNYTSLQPVAPQQGICPTGWRLPRGGTEATTSGDAGTTANEFAILDIAFGGTGQAQTFADTFYDWLSSSSWNGVYSGRYNNSANIFNNGYSNDSLNGHFGVWLSSNSNANAPTTYDSLTLDSWFYDDYENVYFSTYPYAINTREKQSAGAVRCVLQGATPYINTVSSGGVSPNTGPITGGTQITIKGSGFKSAFGGNQVTNVTVGGAECTAVTVISATSLTCITPSSANTGIVSVSVTTVDGTYTRTNAFTYQVTMQSFTAAQCTALSTNASLNATDTRDGKIYKIRKMADGKCWMIDNLAFDLANSAAPAYSPAAHLISGTDGTDPSVDTQAQYFAHPYYDTAAGDAIYLYNWCAAMGDTSADCATTLAYAANQPSGSVQGICPTGWRLPRGGDEATTSGDAGTTTNEFAILDIALGGKGQTGYNGGYQEGDSASYWQWLDYWFSYSHVGSGMYSNGLTTSGEELYSYFGAWLSSSAFGNLVIFEIYWDDPLIGFGYNNTLLNLPISAKSTAGAVRCVLQ